jgi:transcriptional regulator with XRE-family HTH domain
MNGGKLGCRPGGTADQSPGASRGSNPVSLTVPRLSASQRTIVRPQSSLHNVIALDIVNQAGPLSGEKIRFLRKYAGFPAQKFARLLGVTPEHLSRVENGHEAKLGDPTDRLVRALALTARNTEEIRKILLSVADKLEKKARTKPEALRFKLKKSGGWAAAA